MKKQFWALMLLLLIAAALPIAANAASSGTCGDNLTWKLSDSGVLTISGTGAMSDYGLQGPWGNPVKQVKIANGVTRIGDYAFYGCSSLTSVTIPDSVTSIGYQAFSGCISLTSVMIPNSVASIGKLAFYHCDSLTSVTIPNSMTSIGLAVFSACEGLTSVTIPNSVTSIGDEAFCGCSSLTSVTIPNSVTSIGEQAFSGCHSLTSVTIPDSVTKIGEGAFSFCKKLTKINVASGNNSFCSVNGVLMNKAKTKIIQYPGGVTGTYTIPSSVTSIGIRAFADCSLTSITIPSSVTSIGRDAFAGCSNALTIYCYLGSAAQEYAWSEGIHFVLLDPPTEKPTITTQPASVTVNEGAKATFKVTADNATAYLWEYRKTSSSAWLVVKNNGKSSTYTLTAEARHNGYQYRCLVGNSVGHVHSKTVTLTVNCIPVITTQPVNAKVDEGSTATFRVVATGATSYQWYYRKNSSSAWTAVSSNGTSDTYKLVTEPRHNGYQYRCLVKNSTASVYSNIVTLTVNCKPVIHIHPTSVTVTVGKTATFKVTATGATGYQWYYYKPNDSKKYMVSSNGTNATYTLKTEARHNGYKYQCKVYNNAGFVWSNTVTLTVTPEKPVITVQPTNQKVNEGAKATFKVAASGATAYQWYYNKPNDTTWRAVSKNGTSATYILTTEARHNGYKYQCKVSNSGGDIWSKTVTLTLNLKPVITQQPVSVSVTAGEKATFKVTATGASSYQWYYQKPGETVWNKVSINGGGTSATYTLTTAKRHNGFKYKCEVTNAVGSVFSSVVTLTVK